MDSTPPQPIGPGQRLLAAIVFTDVVSFSARMQAEEVATLHLLERDFGLMRAICEKYSGSVLKTTGDGLLLYFTSAVNAVACALKIQRSFAERARTEPAAEALTHRVGIHLGDVFVNNEDVMGDGVNIAARLQAQAEAGGICISQTVYDVVKNKLKLSVEKLEPRELKNISERVPMYRVLLEPAKSRLAAARLPVSPLLKPAAPAATLTRTHKLVVFVSLIAALGVAAWLLVAAYHRNQEELARSRADQAALGALLGKKSGGPATNPSDSSVPPTRSPAEGGPAEDNFAALLLHPTIGGPGAGKDGEATRRRAAGLVPVLFAWMDTGLQRYSQDKPLLVHPLGGQDSGDLQVFTDAGHRLYFAEGGAIRPRNWADLPPEVQGAIVVSALVDAPLPPPRDVARAADAFAYLHGLPEIVEALHSGRK